MPETVSKVLAGAAADLLLTDPPYNVDYAGKTKSGMKIDNDNLEDEEFPAVPYKIILCGCG